MEWFQFPPFAARSMVFNPNIHPQIKLGLLGGLAFKPSYPTRQWKFSTSMMSLSI